MPDTATPGDVERLRALVTEMTRLATALTPAQILEHVVEAALTLSEGELAWILEPDPVKHTLISKTANFYGEKVSVDLSIPVVGSQEGWVFLHQKPIMIDEMIRSQGVNRSMIEIPGKDLKSIMILPLSIIRKSPIVLEIANKRDGTFTQIDQEILTSYLIHAALCLDKSQRSLQYELIPELVHELRTPLASLNTALQLLQRPALPEEKRKQISEMIQSEFNRLTDLTTTFLDYARLESGKEKFKFTRFDLKELMTETIDMIQMQTDGNEIKFSLKLPSEPLYLEADRDKIKQVVLNLLTNAVKYDKPDGNVCLEANSSASVINFSVEDDGPGIPPEFIPRLFERFYRIPNTERQVMGTGLGLPICKHIVEAHQGKIEVSSKLGQGTKVTVQLPIQHQAIALRV